MNFEPLAGPKMDGITGLNIASCIVKGEFDVICPEFRVKGIASKKKRGEAKEKENTLYKPFNWDCESVRSYVKASPKCVELLDLLGSQDKETRCRALALISYVMREADDVVTTRIAEHIVANCSNLMPTLFINDDVTIYYLLDVILEAVRVLTNDKIRFLIRTTDLYSMMEKYHATIREDESFTVLHFYRRLTRLGVITGDLGKDLEGKSVCMDVMDIFYINGKKKACVLLMLGLKGFNIFEKGNIVKLLFDHIKGDSKVSGTCMLHILIHILSIILNKYCNHLSLPDERSRNVPLNVIELMSTHLSRLMNGEVVGIFMDFLETIETYCDTITLSNVLLKFDITEYTLEPLLGICKRDRKLSRHYLSNTKCKYAGNAEYMILLKFALEWLEVEEKRPDGDSDVVLPAFMTKAFFNHGLLSKNKKCIHATLFLLCKFMDVLDTPEPFIPLFPDFKTIVNCKSFKEDEMVLHVKGSNVDVEISLPNEMLIDWLTCLSKYAATLDMNSLYDPCKLLKDERIAENVDFLSKVFSASSLEDISLDSINDALKLDLAVMDCLFHLGIKSSESFIGKVQETAFRYILQRFTEVNSEMKERYKEYRERSREYILAVMESTGIIDDNAAPYVDSLRTMNQHKLFMFLFNACTTKPLDVLYGIGSGGNVKRVKAICTNCLLDGYLQESLFLRLMVDIVLQRDSEDDVTCTECSETFSNIARMVKKQGIVIEDAMIYIKDVCKGVFTTSLVKDGPKEELSKLLCIDTGEYIDTASSGMTEDSTKEGDEENSSNDNSEKPPDSYLEIYATLVKNLEDADHVYVPKMRMMIQDSLKNQGVLENDQSGGNPEQFKDPSSLYTNLFVMTMRVLEAVEFVPSEDARKLLQELAKKQSDLLLPLFCIAHHVDGALGGKMEKKVQKELGRLLKKVHLMNNTQLIHVSMAMKRTSQDFASEKIFTDVIASLKRLSPCTGCSDLSECNFVRMTLLLKICTHTLPINNLKLCLETLQSGWLFDIAKIVTGLNSHIYFLGDNVEHAIFKSFLELLSKIFGVIFKNVGSAIEIKKSSIRRLFGVLAPCYRCSFAETDLLLKDIIFSIINLANGLISDHSKALKLPAFNDFLCTDLGDVSPYGNFSGKHDWQSVQNMRPHGSSWVAMATGTAMRSTESNWLCLNSKRVNSTVSNLELQMSGRKILDGQKISETLYKLSILYPPIARAVSGTDVLFGYIIRLNKALGATTRCIQDFIVNDPYVYDLEYLLLYVSGRLCLVLQSQLRSLSEFTHLFEGLNGNVPPFEVFKKLYTDKDAEDASKRLCHQYRMVESGEKYQDDTIDIATCIDSCVTGGVLELAVLGLLNERTKKASVRSLALFTKILENSIDVTILKSHTPNSAFKLKRLEYRSSFQVLSLLYNLETFHSAQDELLEEKRDPAMHIIFTSQALKRVVKPEDPLYQEINKFILSKQHRNVRDIPLFYECFIAQDVKTQRTNLAFILNILSIYTSVSGNYDILSKRHVFQHILSYSLVNTVHLEHVSQIALIILKASSRMHKELLDIDIHSWICNLSTFVTSRLDESSTTLVWTSFLLTILTHTVQTLSQHSPMKKSARALLESWKVIHSKLPGLRPYHFRLLEKCMQD